MAMQSCCIHGLLASLRAKRTGRAQQASASSDVFPDLGKLTSIRDEPEQEEEEDRTCSLVPSLENGIRSTRKERLTAALGRDSLRDSALRTVQKSKSLNVLHTASYDFDSDGEDESDHFTEVRKSLSLNIYEAQVCSLQKKLAMAQAQLAKRDTEVEELQKEAAKRDVEADTLQKFARQLSDAETDSATQKAVIAKDREVCLLQEKLAEEFGRRSKLMSELEQERALRQKAISALRRDISGSTLEEPALQESQDGCSLQMSWAAMTGRQTSLHSEQEGRRSSMSPSQSGSLPMPRTPGFPQTARSTPPESAAASLMSPLVQLGGSYNVPAAQPLAPLPPGVASAQVLASPVMLIQQPVRESVPRMAALAAPQSSPPPMTGSPSWMLQGNQWKPRLPAQSAPHAAPGATAIAFNKVAGA